MSKLIVNKPCSNCNSPLKSVDCIYYDYNAQISPGHKHNSHKLIGKAICVKNCETYTDVYEQCDCGWPNANNTQALHHIVDSDDELYEVLDDEVKPIDLTQLQAAPITKKIFGTCLRCQSDITSYNMYGGKCANMHVEFYDVVTSGHTRIKRPGNLHSTRIVASPCNECNGEIIAISYVYIDAGVKYNSGAEWTTCKINPNELEATCLCVNDHITNTTVKEVCTCKCCSLNEPVSRAVLFKTYVDTPCTECKYIEVDSIELRTSPISVKMLNQQHLHTGQPSEAVIICTCGHGSIQMLRQVCSCGFDSSKTLDSTLDNVLEEHRTSFITNLCMMCCRETTTANVLCGTHAEYTEVPVTCLKGHRTQQQLFSKCTCGFKSNGYIEPLALVATPWLTPVPRNPCMICDRPIVHITYQKPTSSVFINDHIHNHINDTYTSVAVCVNGHHTSTTVAYHCTCGWPNAARLKKWQRIQELAAHHKDLKYIEDPILAIDNNEHTINDKPLEQFEKHTLLAETMYAPAYACSICDANIRYISTITHDNTKQLANNMPYSDGPVTHLHDSTMYGIVTCKNYHVTRDKIIRYCSCGWPNKSSANTYIDTLAEMDKAPDPHQHTGNCRCLKIMPKSLPTNPLYKCINIQKQDDEQLPQPVLLNIGDSHTGDTQQLTTKLVAKYPCDKCGDIVNSVVENCRTEMYCMPFVDDNNKRHTHDRNKIIGDGTCVNGHTSTKIDLYEMCECGWPLDKPAVTDLSTKLVAKHPCYQCGCAVSRVIEMFSTLAYYRPFVDSSNKRHTHNQNIVKGDGVCTNGHALNNIELCYKCECGWPEDTNAKPLHIHTFNTEPCCICAAETKAITDNHETKYNTATSIFTLVKCTNNHQTSQRCKYTCGPPCYIDNMLKSGEAREKKRHATRTMEKFKPVTANGFTSQLLYGNCPTCSGTIVSCVSTTQIDMLYKPVHNHDRNTISGTFTCVNGHTVTQQIDAKCSCGWVRSNLNIPKQAPKQMLKPAHKQVPKQVLAKSHNTLADAIDAGLTLD